MPDIDLKIIEKAAKAGFAAAAANAAKQYELGKPVTWQEHLTDDDREHELIRTRAALSAAAPLIAAKALRGFAATDARTQAEWERATARADAIEAGRSPDLPLHRTEAGYPNCSTCDGGGCPDCTDPA